MDLSSNDLAAMHGDEKHPSPPPHHASDYTGRRAQLLTTRRRTRDVICLRCSTIDHATAHRSHCRFCVGDVVPYTPEDQ